MTDGIDWQPGVVFTHTLSLTLDDKAQETLQGIRSRLMAAGVPVLHQPAHITIAAVSTMEGVDSHLVDAGWPAKILLTTSCRLPNSDGVVALCPHNPTPNDPVTISDATQGGGAELCTATAPAGNFRASQCLPESLQRPHELLHRRLAAAGVIAFNYYGPRWWNPHVTMGYQVLPELQGRAVRILAGVVPLDVGVAGVSVWRVGDGYTYRLFP
ncbi:hypothetical protein FYJ43_00260 [Cutibacterium sp. WCA-380-WT-3A]|uniref:2'-5' RNA ligase n=1 Tax=Cutibacterium porci TaxID=2605781 RepID=A0A7K0J3M3_9ACTN|nr:hypothetical protein [Cutibacterium porci]MSS44521.1 hypothetical protein [Cutibacterium porci]